MLVLMQDGKAMLSAIRRILLFQKNLASPLLSILTAIITSHQKKAAYASSSPVVTGTRRPATTTHWWSGAIPFWK
jgi:hypothetical protein